MNPIHRTTPKVCLLGVLFLALSGCTTYSDRYVPPSTEGGRFCVAQCTASKQTCNLSETLMKQSQTSQCDDQYRRGMNAYQQCSAMNPPGRCTAYRTVTQESNGRRETVQVCTSNTYVNACVKPESCRTPTRVNACESSFKACYSACGGRIDRVQD